ncbi:MAG: prenyltransferase [Nitrosopumilus sp.]|nr:prenyltransferase [Nitrosopumilus sp.]CAI9831354.1 1,4-dihydroxy-2-naphthoate octaprenyltransferase [Nitrosopumilaceae archaeon]MDA7940906.1 prenyltransferase [Nitrosopumilus sp.]MDA7943238.1 prenyltransferase [Nitrosopumilus sp.]MDA7944269.1 prenyltransferase [Nitrosopumilus sp.]
MISAWLRVVRARFLLASVVSVSAGLSVAWAHTGTLDPWVAAVTLGGVLALHASVDLLNDYWDYRRGIDTPGTSTGVSGGTGVLPGGLLDPASVYRAGIAMLVLGAAAGAYLAVLGGPLVALLLAFAVVSVLLYSTSIACRGLGELFVGAKGALIVAGTSLLQAGEVLPGSVFAGIAAGSLSALVLYAASMPDSATDAPRGRRTLAVIAGPSRSRLFWAFPAAYCAAVCAGVLYGPLPWISLAALLPLPLAARAAAGLAGSSGRGCVPHVRTTIAYSRISGAALVAAIAASPLL